MRDKCVSRLCLGRRTRKIRSKADAQYCTSGRRVKHLSKIEGVVDERRGVSKYCGRQTTFQR